WLTPLHTERDKAQPPRRPDEQVKNEDGQELAQDNDLFAKRRGQQDFERPGPMFLAHQTHGNERHRNNRADDRKPRQQIHANDRPLDIAQVNNARWSEETEDELPEEEPADQGVTEKDDVRDR